MKTILPAVCVRFFRCKFTNNSDTPVSGRLQTHCGYDKLYKNTGMSGGISRTPVCSRNSGAERRGKRNQTMDQNTMRDEQEDLNAAASEEVSARQDTEEASAAPQDTEQQDIGQPQDTDQQPQSGEDEPQADAAEAPEDGAEEPKQPKKDLKLTLVLAAVIALLAVAAIFLASKLKDGSTLNAEPVAIVHENASGFTSYTMTEEQATPAVLDQKVASCGEWTLTNRTLAFYYWQQYSNMYQQYGQYLAYFLQNNVGLDEQTLPSDESATWQQTFLNSAIDNFGVIAAVVQDAEKNGFVLNDELQAQIDDMRGTLEDTAVNYGYANADAFLQDLYGASANLEDYLVFVRNNTIAYSYLNEKVNAIAVSADDLSAYYDAHAEEYETNGLKKVDKPMITVRHILIAPEDPEGTGEFTDEAWAAAKEEADRIYAEWEASDKTEETFSQMANEYSTDPGSNTNGGLYENVYPGQMVEEFNDWCFDDARSEADYGIVKTRFGYHIILYVSAQDEIYWQSVVRSDYLNDQWSAMQEEICAAYPVESDLSMAGVLNIPLFTPAETESDAAADAGDAAGTDSSSTEPVKE